MADDFTFKDNRPAVKSRLDQFVEKALTTAGMILEANINPLIPTDTTALLMSLKYEVDISKKTMFIGVNTPYAIYVEFGTGVFAENGSGRKTPWWYQDEDGDWHRTIGQKPMRYMRDGYENSRSDIEKQVRQIFKGF